MQECEFPIPLLEYISMIETAVTRRATRDRNTTAYEYNYKAMNLIRTNLFVHTFIMNTITEST